MCGGKLLSNFMTALKASLDHFFVAIIMPLDSLLQLSWINILMMYFLFADTVYEWINFLYDQYSSGDDYQLAFKPVINMRNLHNGRQELNSPWQYCWELSELPKPNLCVDRNWNTRLCIRWTTNFLAFVALCSMQELYSSWWRWLTSARWAAMAKYWGRACDEEHL